jgi:TolB-like protein/Tfp pilus assembly protein PilF
MSKPSFFTELKRRNVLRAAALYIGAAWALSQGVAQILPVFDFPNWVVRWFVIAAMIGFPFAMLFSWFYEWTSQGIVRESEVAPEESVTRETGRKMDRWIFAVMALAIVLLLANTFVPHKDVATAARQAKVPMPGKSIAVLPLTNLSGDPKNDYFSDGITEEILDALTQLPALKVAARTSTFAFKGKNQDLRRIGQELGVANVLEGSVQTAGDQVRINVELVDTASGNQLWSEHYDRKMTNLFAVEDEISRAIVQTLQVRLESGDERELVGGRTRDPRAHDLYLRGLSLLPGRGPGLRDAATYFEQAVAIDPTYAQAWASLALTYSLFPGYQLADWKTADEKAKAAAQRAMTLDPGLAESHVAMSFAEINRMQLGAAEQEYRKALAINPGSVEAHNMYGQLLAATGRIDEGIAQERIAEVADPYSNVVHYKLGTMLAAAHRYPESIVELEKSLQLAPDFYYARFELGATYLYMAKYSDAERELRLAASQAHEDPDVAGVLVHAVADPAARPKALQLLEQDRAVGRFEMYDLAPAFWWSLLGAREPAIARIQRWAQRASLAEHYGGMWGLFLPGFDPVRSDPRFKSAAHVADTGVADGKP